MQIKANGITLEVAEFGPADGTPLILIRGLGTQMVHWPDQFIAGFAARGYRTIIFDNRDVGLSARCPRPGAMDTAEAIVAAVKSGGALVAAYDADEFARDVTGLMDALGIDRAHVFGISMGGMITQMLACDHPDRLLSATMVMTSARSTARDRVDQLVDVERSRDEAMALAVRMDGVWGSPRYLAPPEYTAERAGRAWDRGHDPEGVNRQLVAIGSGPRDRGEALREVRVPCLVIHGRADTLIPYEEGRYIAGCIPGAVYLEIDGFGHVITPRISALLAGMVDGFIRGQAAAS